MEILKNEYKSFLEDIQKNMKNKQDLEYVKKRFLAFVDVVMEEIGEFQEKETKIIKKLELKQKSVETKMEKMQQIIDKIEKDIYSDEGFDFEIVCPYCDYVFVVDLDDNKREIQCPECENIIELDWTGDLEEKDDKHYRLW